MAAVLATFVVHLSFLSRHLLPDEGGFAMVARFWGSGGRYLYGPLWVDRPPGLLLVFDAADHLGAYGVRLVAVVMAVALVAAVGLAADVAGGPVAASWAAWAGFAFTSSSLLGAEELNGELIAGCMVSVSMAALLRSVHGSGSLPRLLTSGAVAGASAMAAALVKQNFVDALVFGVVLVVLSGAAPGNRRSYRPRAVAGASAGFVVGAAVPALAAVVWAVRQDRLRALLYAMYGFRADAAAVMARWSWHAPLHRLGELVVLAFGSGLFVLLVHLALRRWRRLRAPDPLAWAVTAAAAVELAGSVLGENYWPHYLLAVVPSVALAAGLSARRRVPGWRGTRVLVVAASVVTAVAAGAAAMGAVGAPAQAYTVGRWVAASAARGDSLVVPFTHANVLDASRLRPGYPYAWSLPVRTLDPRLRLLVRTLYGRTAPTWIVQWDAADTWGLDPHGTVGAALHRQYRLMRTVCGRPVWLRRGVHRQLAPLPPATLCGGEGLRWG